jgi:hypothetical protein
MRPGLSVTTVVSIAGALVSYVNSTFCIGIAGVV